MHHLKPIDYQLHLEFNGESLAIHVPHDPYEIDILRTINASESGRSPKYAPPIPPIKKIAAAVNAMFAEKNIAVKAIGAMPQLPSQSGIVTTSKEKYSTYIILHPEPILETKFRINAEIKFKIGDKEYSLGPTSAANLFRAVVNNRTETKHLLLGGVCYPLVVDVVITIVNDQDESGVISTEMINSADDLETAMASIEGKTATLIAIYIDPQPPTFGFGNNEFNPYDLNYPIDWTTKIEHTMKFHFSELDGYIGELESYYPEWDDTFGKDEATYAYNAGTLRSTAELALSGEYSTAALDRNGYAYGEMFKVEQLNFKAGNGILIMRRSADAPMYQVVAPRLVDVAPGVSEYSKVCVLNDYLPYGIEMNFDTSERKLIDPNEEGAG